MNRSMWSRLRWLDEFALDTLSIRMGIEVDSQQIDSPGASVSARILPEIGYTFDLISDRPTEISPAKMSQSLRERLRSKRAAVRFFYSLERHSFAGWEQLIHPVQGDEAPQEFDRIPAVLIPRHFVATQEAHSLSKLCALADTVKEGVSRLSFALGGDPAERCLVFYAPSLVAGIRRAYEENTYGDELHWMRLALSRVAGHFGSFDGEVPWKRISIARLDHYRPSYWCLDPSTQNTGGPTRWRWEYLSSLQKTAAENCVDWDFVPAPDEAIESGFNDLLRDCDADFLLRGLSSEIRGALRQSVEAWIQHIADLIRSRYDVDDSDGMGRVIAAVDEALRPQAAARKGELKGWVQEALAIFSCRSSRVVRKAVEIAQRCVLAGLNPIPIAVETENEIFARWTVFLRLTLRSRFRRKKSLCITCPEEAASDGFDFETSRVSELIDLIKKLVEFPQDRNIAGNVAAEASGSRAEILIWEQVIEPFEGSPVKPAIEDVLRMVADADRKADSITIENVMARFALLSSTSSPSKIRKRMRRGE